MLLFVCCVSSLHAIQEAVRWKAWQAEDEEGKEGEEEKEEEEEEGQGIRVQSVRPLLLQDDRPRSSDALCRAEVGTTS